MICAQHQMLIQVSDYSNEVNIKVLFSRFRMRGREL